MPNIHRLLIVDGDPEFRTALIDQLTLHDEFRISSVSTGKEALDIVQIERFDLIIMSICLPDTIASIVTEELRKDGFSPPIILVGSSDLENEAITALEAGADDYMLKPIRFFLLLQRILTQLRQYETSDDTVFQIGHYQFKPGSKQLIDPKGNKLKLTEKETAILRFLQRAEQATVSRDILLTEVWGYNTNVNTHTLETHIYRLRQKIETNPANASILITEPGGYKLVT